jgi:hypothetical protein
MEDTTTTSRSSSSSNIPTQRQTLWQWIVMCGKNSYSSKEDKFIWQPLSSYFRDSREEILYTPNNHHNIDDQWVLEDVLSKSRIRGRKKWIDFILLPSYNSHDDDDQQNNLKEQISNIETCYKERRMEVRNLSNIYIANNRHRHQNDLFPPEPLVVGDNGDQPQNQSTVQIDRHGRLVRSRQDGSNHGNDDDDDDDDDNTDDNNEIVELVDAADTFWKKHKQKSDSKTNGRRGVSSVSTSSSTAASQRTIPLQQHQPPPPMPPPPLLPNPLNEQQIRERNISQQMENESRQAIERAIHRYRGQQQQQEGDEAIFELVHIPLMPQRNDVNVPRWLRFLSLNRQQRQGQQQELMEGDNIPHRQQQQNHHPNELQHQQQQQQNQHHNHNGENWIDLRLALRRICFAVITVVAAFLCMMLQGLPTYVDFDDEYYGMMDMDAIFLSGLLGPYAHYPGQHHRQQQQQQQQSRNEWTYQDVVLREDGESDIQQSIWNRLLSEDSVFDQGHHDDDDGSGEEL